MVRPPSLRFSDVLPILQAWHGQAWHGQAWHGQAWHADVTPEAALAPISRWLQLLCEWNARMDLTAARTPAELVDLMLADAAALAPDIPAGARVVDVGTGAGAPGLGLALLRPDLAVTLCEPLAKRTSFLRTVIGSVGRTDVVVVNKRGEDLVGTAAWDVAMARATLLPPEWLALGAKLVKPGGSVWVLLAGGEPPAQPGAKVAQDDRYTWRETGAQRRAVRYEITAT